MLDNVKRCIEYFEDVSSDGKEMELAQQARAEVAAVERLIEAADEAAQYVSDEVAGASLELAIAALEGLHPKERP